MSEAQYNFGGYTAVVTGGAQGIGLTIVQRMIASGANVAVWDVDPSRLRDAVPGNLVTAQQVDVTSAKEVSEAAAQVIHQFGRVDMLVNSAGVAGPIAPLWDYEIDDWRRVIEVNLIGTYLTCRTCVPEMIKAGWGRVVNISSIAGKEGNPNASAYSAAKAGVIGMTKSLGKELAKTDIRVNAITPAAVRTAIFDQLTQAHIDMMLSKIPMGRFGTTDEIAALCMWLCSKDCSFSTGAVFDASGGRAVY